MLSGDRILCTWDYYQAGNVPQGRALMYTISADAGISWSDNRLIFDPDTPPDPSIDMNQHLGTLRHSILPLDDGRWLLPLTQENDLGPHKYPGVKIYDPETGTLVTDRDLSPGMSSGAFAGCGLRIDNSNYAFEWCTAVLWSQATMRLHPCSSIPF
jgi:hypothetical protein